MPKHLRWDEQHAEELRAWLRQTCTERGLTQSDVVWMVSGYRRTNPKTVEAWFQGRSMPSYPLLVALALVFGELPPAFRGISAQAQDPLPKATGEGSQAGATGTDDIVATR